MSTVPAAPGLAPAGLRPRLLATVALLGCAAVYAAGLTSGPPAGLAVLSGFLLWGTAYVLLRRQVQEAADLPDERLDEREVALRDRAYLSAYRSLGAALALSMLLAIAEDALDRRIVESWYHPLTAILLLSLVLPSIVLALTTQVFHDPDE